MVENKTHGYLETHPQPRLAELSRYYDSDDYISHTDSKKGLMSFLYQTVKKYSLKKKVRLLKDLSGSEGAVLDIGAGTGDFLKLAQQSKWKVTGVEVSEKARSIAREKEVVLYESLQDLPNQLYDVVTLWHVLEHLPNLEEQIAKIESLIKPGGALIIAVPNFNSYDAVYYKEFWAAFDVPRHLWHFSRSSMKTLFSPGLEQLKTRPMVFDAFYVALLSQKYKTGSSFSLRGLWVGLRSNLFATRTKEYSSLIYCYRRTK